MSDRLDVKILKKNEEKMTFVISGISDALAGELRRIMMTEIPTMAIEWVDFVKNGSALWDEIIASRLGLIPLVFDQKFYNLKDECKCKGKGCVHCQVTLSLKKRGPCTVYAKDLVPSDEKVRPIHEKIPIVKLAEGQELQLEAIAQLGRGVEHAKWQASVVGYKMDEGGKKYTFKVETTSGLNAKDIALKGIDVLSNKLDEFSSDLRRLK